ncbi:MAG: PIN domain-containing protein [Spirochaetia bacterium]|jgi:predicted nucleic acid-binding protein
MVGYFDSSILLAGILGQESQGFIASLWDLAETRLSSILSKIECVIGVRRAATLQKLAPDSPWCRERIRLLEAFLEELNCKRIDEDILGLIRENSLLSNCRSLDAIHVATALYFKPYHDEPIQIVTLDGRMREAAGKAGFAVLPS